MFGIPGWVVGVVAILGGVGVMALLEERLDFAERLLARQREAERVLPPKAWVYSPLCAGGAVFFGIPEWAIGVGFIIVAGSLARALTGGFTPSSRLRGRKMHPREIGPALEEMQRRLDALEEGQQRIGAGDDAQARLNEVEERLDFVERMLTKQRDAERVSPPKP